MMIKNWLILEKDDLDKKIRHYSVYRFLLLVSAIAGFLISFFMLWERTNSPKMKFYDQTVMNFISQVGNSSLVNFFGLITNLGSNYFIGLVFAVLVFILIRVRRKKAAAVSLFSILGSVGFIYLFKHLFGRPRPLGCLGNDCFSYPSGHSTIALYFYGLLDYLIFRFLPVSFKIFLLINFIIISTILLIGASRLFLQFHFLSDVFAGFFLGGAWLLVAVLLIDILYHQV